MALHVAQCFEVGLVSDGADGSPGGAKHFWRDLDTHQFRQARDCFIFNGGKVSSAVFESNRTDLAQCLRVNQIHCQMNKLAISSKASLHNDRGTQFALCGARVDDFMPADFAGRHYPQRLLAHIEVGQPATEAIHESFRDSLICGIIADVLEGKDSDVLFMAAKEAGDAVSNGGNQKEQRQENRKRGKTAQPEERIFRARCGGKPHLP